MDINYNCIILAKYDNINKTCPNTFDTFSDMSEDDQWPAILNSLTEKLRANNVPQQVGPREFDPLHLHWSMCLTRWEQQAGPTLYWFKSILFWDINFNPGGQRENSGEKSFEGSWQPHHKVMVPFAKIEMEVMSGTVFWAGSPHVVRPSMPSLARWRADWETRWPIIKLIWRILFGSSPVSGKRKICCQR